ncbi:hypothetical protein MICAG_1970032 [Microcystis aeruginosa PCC 9808]|uniref:Uncharacterized protein n=1 Tax=Microcystis aeruginosa PCC 9808 TaxID=1160284 RepID=I4HM87_MICAE|nr:hypothetical protein MICAG_1970032 [Microcystis aeruginosa PCC 9808]
MRAVFSRWIGAALRGVSVLVSIMVNPTYIVIEFDHTNSLLPSQ